MAAPQGLRFIRCKPQLPEIHRESICRRTDWVFFSSFLSHSHSWPS